MCMGFVEEIIAKPTWKEVEVWKAFNVVLNEENKTELHSVYYGLNPCDLKSSKNIPTGVWLKAEEGDIPTIFNKYPMGFHGFLKHKDAVAWGQAHCDVMIVKRVKFRRVVAYGRRDSSRSEKIVVAKEMWVD